MRRADDPHPLTGPRASGGGAELRVRADFSAHAWLAPHEHHWIASPEAGVERVMLDRIGGEQAIATSLVRYAPGSRFAGHSHPRGEEFLVLDGVFEDEHGAYPAGTYVRNPHGSHHQPGSTPGCLLFVKLRQFQPGDDQRVVIDTNAFARPVDGSVRVHRLHHYGDETVTMVDGGAGARHRLDAVPLLREILVVDGHVRAAGCEMAELAWLRAPAGCGVDVEFEASSRIFVKIRPLPQSD
jgi:anti-sigma factor ChrR (cupin superfamily)